MHRRRVFVTGMGVVSPTGNDVEAAFERVFAGESSVRLVPAEEGVREEPAILAPSAFDLGSTVPRIQSRLMARASQMAVLATGDALASAGLSHDPDALSRLAAYMGCALGGSEALEDHYGRYRMKERMRPATVPMIMPNGPVSHMSMQFGIRGPTVNYSVACVSSAIALGEAFRALRDGYVDRALAGGSEAQLTPGTVAAWVQLQALAKEHADGPKVSSRPFDAERTGLVMGEGAAVLVLESEEAMEERGAIPLAEVVGYGVASDSHSLTEPLADGQVAAMRSALGDAAVEAEQIGYVNAHATGTVVGDRVECAAIKETFGAHAASVPVSSTKGVHGHLIGAAGALEAVWTVRALQTSRVPPTAHLTKPDPECDLDCVPLIGRASPDLEYALSNSFAFGGTNAALVFKRAGVCS